jgi:hypothetical protein
MLSGDKRWIKYKSPYPDLEAIPAVIEIKAQKMEDKMDIVKQVLKVVFGSILLLFSLLISRQPHKAYYDTDDQYIFSPRNAPSSTRSESITQLEKFQAGYTQRDLDQVDKFMEQLFSKDNLLVLGTMPDEIFIGHEEVSKLIYSDWNAWGDVKFMINTANI